VTPRTVPPFQPGQRLDAARLEQMRQELYRASRSVTAGAAQSRTWAGGTAVLAVGGDDSAVRRCRNTTGIPGTIAAINASHEPGVGAVTFYAWDGTAKTLGTETATVLNDGPTPVPAAAEMFVFREFGVWWVLGWWCDPVVEEEPEP
jgi:hypothetical protein